LTVALIVLFVSLASCALIGWGFIRVLGIIARSLRRQARPPLPEANDPTIVFRNASAHELAESARTTSTPPPSGGVETYFEGGRWKNKVHGNSRASNVHKTRAAAVTAGREMARRRKVEHVIKSEGGAIQERSNYGNDPLVLG
jgi:hypothetical protein